jgi:mRNA interferase MazF
MVNDFPRAPKQGEIIWINFDPQSGQEQSGRRPALVLSHASYNEKVGRAFVCPITTKIKNYPFEVAVSTPTIGGVILADHCKNLDWRSRNITNTHEQVSKTQLTEVWELIQSIV